MMASLLAEAIAVESGDRITIVSTFIMTVLLSIGLFFFIRASGKDRIEIRRYRSELSVQDLGSQLQAYLKGRSYRLLETDETGLATFVGQAQPSGFLTGLLTALAAVGLLCLVLVWQMVQPQLQGFTFLLLALSPLAGWYYRKTASREETLRVRVRQGDSPELTGVDIAAHRDELNELQQQLPLEEL